MSKIIKQLKTDIMYLLRIIRLFNGRDNPVDLRVCKQYKELLKRTEKEIEILEDEDKHNS